jgi:hypothetical protein
MDPGASCRFAAGPGYPLQFLPLRGKNSASIPCAGQTASRFGLSEFHFVKLQELRHQPLRGCAARKLIVRRRFAAGTSMPAGCCTKFIEKKY